MSEEMARAHVETAAPSGPIRILHVEDSLRDADLLRETLAADGLACEIVRVDTKSAYAQALSCGQFDLIVCDYTLPSFRGEEALALASSGCPDTPFLFLSGTIGEEKAVEALKSGATDYVLKDNLTRLPASVRRALREARERAGRREAEGALRASEERYRRLFERNLAGVFRSSVDGRILECNQAFAHILGYDTQEEMLAVPASDLYPDPSDREAALRRIQQEGSLIGFETCFRRRDGTPIWILENVTLLDTDGDGNAVLEGTLIDITERKRLEEQVLQSQKMEAIGRLAGGVAHDFNNVLTAILGYSDLLTGSLPPASPLREDVEEIRKAADRAAALTRQLLAFSRKQVLVPELLNLNLLIHDVEKMLRRVIGEDIEIRTRCDPALGRVRGDPGQLGQVLVNLVINARDAMPAGGTVTIETRNADFEELRSLGSDEVRGPAVMLSIGDTGVGMDPETKLRIFEPFYTTKEKGKGTGLGLATVYGIVEQSGGRIEVWSEPGRGSTFRILLPRVDDAG
jgi:two-component system cell cycle sensor histidine kinase/response regulator CckA